MIGQAATLCPTHHTTATACEFSPACLLPIVSNSLPIRTSCPRSFPVASHRRNRTIANSLPTVQTASSAYFPRSPRLWTYPANRFSILAAAPSSKHGIRHKNALQPRWRTSCGRRRTKRPRGRRQKLRANPLLRLPLHPRPPRPFLRQTVCASKCFSSPTIWPHNQTSRH